MVHQLKPLGYLRYGDDFIILSSDRNTLESWRLQVALFLKEFLTLTINPKNDIIVKAKHGLHFLGVDIFPKGRRLKQRNHARINERLNVANLGSYHGLIKAHANYKKVKEFQWKILNLLENIF